MKDKYKDLVIDVALKYWPTNGKWQDDAREALSELESVNEQLDVTEIKKIIGDTISSSLLSAGTSQEELDVHVNVVLVEIQKRLKKKTHSQIPIF